MAISGTATSSRQDIAPHVKRCVFLEAGEHLRHVHIARTLGRSLPREGDECGWQDLFCVLKETGYNGDISIEARAPAENREECIRESLRFLKSQAE